MKEQVTRTIERLGIIPVIVLEEAAAARPLAKALLEGGLPCAEVTFRTAAAAEAISCIAQEHPEVLVGAGTVLRVEQAEQAIRSGARFIVAPGFNPRVVDYCIEQGVAVFPGVCTPTDIEAALEKGLTELKFFPAEPMGGLGYLKAISAPYGQVRYIPTGGISAENVSGYLAFKKVLACAGTWMVKKEWISSGQFEQIRQATEQAVRLVAFGKGVKG
jgi:2-dehydro-3-deoxyphosphogluconate aldolase / (4S)-4-hydroxy-2-oxoglutarate aldolase